MLLSLALNFTVKRLCLSFMSSRDHRCTTALVKLKNSFEFTEKLQDRAEAPCPCL